MAFAVAGLRFAFARARPGHVSIATPSAADAFSLNFERLRS